MAAYAQQDFVTSLLAEFPELRDDIEDCDGQLQLEMEAFARYTQEAKARGDMAAYERCLTFADRFFAGADATLGSAFRMSFLEHLEFEGSRGPAAWQLLPPRLQNVWNQIAAENRRLQSLPQKHGGVKVLHDREPRPQGGDSRPHGGDKPHGGGEGKQRGRKRSPRRGRRR